MTPEQLREACGDGTGTIALAINRKPSGEGIRLFPRSGPVGYVMCVTAGGVTTARFEAAAVLRWLDRAEKEHTTADR